MTMIHRLVVCALLLAASLLARRPAREEGAAHRLPGRRVGGADAPRLAAFRQGLRELGYVEGQRSRSSTATRAPTCSGCPSMPAELFA